MANFFNRKREQFRGWWQRPPTRTDRIWSAIIGAWAGLWIGGLGRVIYETPLSFSEFGKFALLGAISAALIGAIFPKTSRIVFYPFAFFGFGGSST